MTDALHNDMTGALREILENLDAQILAFRKNENPDCILLDSMVADALMFLTSLPELLPLPTTVTIEDDGEIVFEWCLFPHTKLNVGLEGDGYYGYLFESTDGHYYEGGYEGRIMGEFPEDLLEYLQG